MTPRYRSYKNVLRAIGRKPIPGTVRTVKRPGDRVLTRTDQPIHVVVS